MKCTANKNSTAFVDFEKRMQLLAEQVDQPVHGFFGPQSMSWKIFSKPGLATVGPRALLMQIAHPAIAAGVDRHSSFKSDTYGRAKRTYEAMMRLIFGDVATATQMARRLFKIHAHVGGAFVENQPNGPRIRRFQATDTDLLLWVQATIVESALLAYEMIYPPLADQEKALFYEESRRLAVLMGIPKDQYPPDLAAFKAYFQSVVEGRILAVGPVGQVVAEDLNNAIWPLRPASALLASQLLPTPLRYAFGLPDNSIQQGLFNFLLLFCRFWFPILPSCFWAPPYHQANYRIARKEGRAPAFIGRAYHWLASNFRFPATANV